MPVFLPQEHAALLVTAAVGLVSAVGEGVDADSGIVIGPQACPVGRHKAQCLLFFPAEQVDEGKILNSRPPT